MKKGLLLFWCALVLVAGCQSKQTETDTTTVQKTAAAPDSKSIIALYKEVDSLTRVGSMDRKKMQQFVDEAVEYANKNTQDTISPHFLLYAGVMQMQVAFSNANEQQRTQQAEEAINILEKLRQNYPDYPNLIYAYYYKGQIYENLGKREEAAKTYRNLVERFPDTELAKNIAAYLQAGGYEKSAEEIWQGFEK